MPNSIKYSASAQTLALKKGNYWIGTGDVGKGPTESTGYYNGMTPPSGGYTIYVQKTGAPGELSYGTAANDSELISYTNNLAGTSYTTAAQCLAYFAGQTDRICFNRDYEGIVTNGLVLDLDAGFTPSYPTTGTTWYNVGGSNNGTLTNSPSFNSGGGGCIVFDGTDDYVNLGNVLNVGTNPFTLEFWAKTESTTVQYAKVISKGGWTSDGWLCYFGRNPITGQYSIALEWYNGQTSGGVTAVSAGDVILNKWYHIVYTKDENNLVSSYTNGYFVSSSNTNTSHSFSSTKNYLIGVGNSNEYFKGSLQSHRMYNRALSAAEVLQNYQASLSRFPILDFYGGSAVSVSLRLLSSSYSGSAIRVRRSSDNTEQDIGFVNGVLDTASLVTFCGSGNGFVSRWYNQGSAGSYFQNTTATEQPSIVTGGVVNTINNKPSILFDGVDDSLTAVGFSTGYGSSTFSAFGVGKRAGSGKYMTFIGTVEGYSGVWLGQGIDDKYSYEFPSTVGPGKVATASSADTTSNQLYLTGIFDGTNSKIYRNGSEVSSAQSTANYDRAFNVIGRRAANPPNFYQRFMDGNIQEIISYTSNQTSNRANIEASIKNYYGI